MLAMDEWPCSMAIPVTAVCRTDVRWTTEDRDQSRWMNIRSTQVRVSQNQRPDPSTNEFAFAIAWSMR